MTSVISTAYRRKAILNVINVIGITLDCDPNHRMVPKASFLFENRKKV